MSNLEFKQSNIDIGLLTRTFTLGPELDMLENAVVHLTKLFSKRGKQTAVFWEPKVDVGFPDLVIAHYFPKIYEKWPSARTNITNADLKIAHQLLNSNGMTSNDLEKMLGIKSRNLLQSLERLLDSAIIQRTNSQWQVKKLDTVFAIDKIIAIEAKLNNWSSALRQAESNLWFASESYVLSPVSKPRTNTRERSLTHGVGILSTSTGIPKTILEAPSHSLPSSYASWQFNEWIGREIALR